MASKNKFRSKKFQSRREESNCGDVASTVKILGEDMSYLWHDPAPLSPDVKPGSLYMHELLDRTHVVNVMVERIIWEHPAIAYDKDWLHLAFTAKCALWELYQRVGAARIADKD